MVADDFRWLLVVLCFINYIWKIRRRHGHEPPSHTKLGLRDADTRGGALPYMGHIGMCRCEGYGFQAVYSSIGSGAY